MQYNELNEPIGFDDYNEFLEFIYQGEFSETTVESFNANFIDDKIKSFILQKVNYTLFNHDKPTAIQSRKYSDQHYYDKMIKHLEESVKHLEYFGLDATAIKDTLVALHFDAKVPKIISKNDIKNKIKAQLNKEIGKKLNINPTDTNRLIQALLSISI